MDSSMISILKQQPCAMKLKRSSSLKSCFSGFYDGLRWRVAFLLFWGEFEKINGAATQCWLEHSEAA